MFMLGFFVLGGKNHVPLYLPDDRHTMNVTLRRWRQLSCPPPQGICTVGY